MLRLGSRFALVLLLAPLVILFQTSPAQAVTYGPAVSFSVVSHSPVTGMSMGQELRCNGRAAYAVFAEHLNVTGNLSCKHDRSITTDPQADSVKNTSTAVQVHGTPATSGAACSASDVGSGNALAGVAFSIGPLPVDCQISRVCITVTYTEDVTMQRDNDWVWQECVDLAMGTPPSEQETNKACVNASVTVPEQQSGWATVEQTDGLQGWNQSAWQSKITAQATATWTSYVIIKKGSAWNAFPGTDFVNNGHLGVQYKDVIGRPDLIAAYISGSVPAGVETSRNLVLRVFKFMLDSPYGIGDTEVIGGGHWLGSASNDSYWTLPQHSAGSLRRVGQTNDTLCYSYWGEKIAETPSDTFDDPIGPIGPGAGGGTPEAPDTTPDAPGDEEGCNFSISDPSSWASGGLCATVGLLGGIFDMLGKILNAVVDLPLRFITELGTLLQELIVPQKDMAARIDAAQLDFEGAFPFNVAFEVAGTPAQLNRMSGPEASPSTMSTTAGGGLATNPGGGCPDWNFSFPGVSDASQNIVCDSSYVQAIRGARPFLLAAMLAVGFWPLIRSLFFASVPVLKPSPTDGK